MNTLVASVYVFVSEFAKSYLEMGSKVSRKVLFVGDANLDLILSGLEAKPQEDKEVFCDRMQRTLGGSCTLCASAFAHLGGDCNFCGLVGNDVDGLYVRDALIEAGVGVSLLRMDQNKQTGVTVNLIQGRNRTQITYRGSLSEVNETEVVLKEIHKYAHIHLSGIYGTKKLLPEIQKILIKAQENGVTTSLDTQWDASRRWKYMDDWLPHLDWLIINDDEATSIAESLGFSREARVPIENVWAFLKERTSAPIIKLGKHGAFANGKNYPPCDVGEIVDTTGAGDSFAATFIYAMVVAKYDLEKAMILAQAGGALACTFVGGYSSKFSLPAVEALL